MLGLIHIIIIAAVSIICYYIFFRSTVINNKTENFNSDNINYHQGNDYNVNYNLNEDEEPLDNNQDD